MPESSGAAPAKPKAKIMVPSDLGPKFSKIEKPDPTKGQTIGRTPWHELQRESPHLFDQDGKYHGPGQFPPETMSWFEFAYKGQQAAKLGRSCYQVTQKLLDELANNTNPQLKVLDVDNRQLIDLEMLKIFEALATKSAPPPIKPGPRLSRPVEELAAHHLLTSVSPPAPPVAPCAAARSSSSSSRTTMRMRPSSSCAKS